MRGYFPLLGCCKPWGEPEKVVMKNVATFCNIIHNLLQTGLLEDHGHGWIYPKFVASFSITNPVDVFPGNMSCTTVVECLQNPPHPISDYPSLATVEQDRGDHDQIDSASVLRRGPSPFKTRESTPHLAFALAKFRKHAGKSSSLDVISLPRFVKLSTRSISAPSM